MEVIRTIKPGMPGTRRFQQHWGENLIAVRYRRDANSSSPYPSLSRKAPYAPPRSRTTRCGALAERYG